MKKLQAAREALTLSYERVEFLGGRFVHRRRCGATASLCGLQPREGWAPSLLQLPACGRCLGQL